MKTKKFKKKLSIKRQTISHLNNLELIKAVGGSVHPCIGPLSEDGCGTGGNSCGGTCDTCPGEAC